MITAHSSSPAVRARGGALPLVGRVEPATTPSRPCRSIATTPARPGDAPGRRSPAPPSAVPNKPRVNFLYSIPVAETVQGTANLPKLAWSCDMITSKRSYISGDVGLRMTVVGEDGLVHGVFTLPKDVKDLKERVYKPTNDQGGIEHMFTIELPSGVAPAAITLEHIVPEGKEKKVEELKTFINSITMTANFKSVTFPIDGYLATQQRVWFSGTMVPSKTPPELLKLRQSQLLALQGVSVDGFEAPAPQATRVGDEIIYQYQTYNDLGGDITKNFEANVRPTLGGKDNPYPRRIRTNRKTYELLGDRPSEYEVGVNYKEDDDGPKGIINELKGLLTSAKQRFTVRPWMPMDDDFSAEKTAGFAGNAIVSFFPLLKGSLLNAANNRTDYENIQEVLSVFDNDDGELEPALRRNTVNQIQSKAWRIIKTVYAKFARSRKDGRNILDATVSAFGKYDQLDDIFQYEAPYNMANTAKRAKEMKIEPYPTVTERVDRWRTDEEFGRQYLAGINPMVIRAMTAGIPPNSGFKEADLTPALEGHSMAELTKPDAPRLFFVNYHDVYTDYLDIVNGTYKGQRVQHAGYCVLYRRDDGHTVPIAISLTSKSKTPCTVYTPRSPGAVWALAKTIFSSIDSGYHQLVSHWLRTHCCQEPYLIATRRQLSAMHPVYKLILPHFRYTMPINANARGSLINANGVIETCFTPGRYSMQLSSAVYGAVWNFKDEALPADLKLRGLLDEQGKVLLPDYPYAEDGLLIWNAIEKYFTKYINHYYASDEEVLADAELKAWWQDIKTEGHADKATDPDCWPELDGRTSLVRILATMAWVGSGHHAAVNFGQYDYSAFMPARSSMIRKAMPASTSEEYEELSKVSADTADKKLLQYVADPKSAMTVTTVVKTLVIHHYDELYLSSPVQEYLTDPVAQQIHKEFVADVNAAERLIDQRNRDPNSVVRSLDAMGLPYRYMIPHSEPGGTGQGVPYSVSI